MKHIQIKTCKDCNKVLSRQNTSGYCRSCSPKHSIIDYSKREIDYSKREIDYSKREIDYSKRTIDYDSMETLYEQDKEINDLALKAIFAQKFLTRIRLRKTAIVPFSHQKQIFLYGTTTTYRGLELLKKDGAITSKGLYKYQDFPCNSYSYSLETLTKLAKFPWKDHLTQYLVHYFGKCKIKRTTKIAKFYREEELDVLDRLLDSQALLKEVSTRKLSKDLVLKDIDNFCKKSGKFGVTRKDYLESLALAVEYAEDNDTEISYLPRKNKKGSYSIRFWNEICSTKNEEHSETERLNYLKSKGLEKFHHFDVHSSIPNIINWYKTGSWEHIDWHTRLAEKTGFSRELVKYFSLPCCFAARNYNVDRLIHNINHHTELQDDRYKEGEALIKAYDKDLTPSKLKEGLGIMLDTYKTTNCRYLFWLESMLYLKVWKKLKERGVKCFMVYDSFYTDKEVDLESIIKEVAKEINLKGKVETKDFKKKVSMVKVEKKDIKLVDSEVRVVKPVSKIDLIYQTSWASLQ